MSFWQKILELFDTKMQTPTLYGWYHIVSIAMTALVIVYLCVCHRHDRPSQIRKTVLFTAILVAVLEIYKQINFSFSYSDGISFDYQWYAFPFQFCSTPMYIGFLAGLTKKGKVHDAACAYLATYAMFAGFCVMFYPATVFIDTIGINVQTMVCHGSMIWIGIYLLATGHVKIEHKTILRAIPVFICLVGMAALMNEIAYRVGLLETETFDMFFISPYGTPSLPVYSMVQGALPFPWCLVVYILGFSLAAYLILLIAMGINKIFPKQKLKITA